MKIDTGLSDKNRKGAVEILNRLLSDEYVLHTKTRNYHWNVTGLMEKHEKMAWMLRAFLK